MAQTKAQLLGPVVGDVVMDVSTLSLDAEGNKVGIGTTEADLTLHVNGVNALPSSSGSTPTGHLTLRNKSGNASHGMFMGVSNAAPWSSWIQAQDANNNATNYPLLLNPNGGNIGINQTNPTRKLHITTASGSDTAGSTDSHLLFDVADDSGPGWVQRVYDSGAGSGGQDGSFALDRSYSGSWVNAVTIKRDTGNIGIGQINPTADLEVVGSTGTASTLFINAPTHSSSAVSEAVLKFGYAHSGSPDAVAEIKLVEGSTNSFGGHLTFSVPDNNGSGGSSTSEKLRITSSGNVGIGTTNPTAKTHISLSGDTAEPVLYLHRANNSGGGAGNPEIGLEVNIPNTFNSAGTVYGVKVFARHNLGAEHYGGYFEAGGNAYTSGIGVYAKTTHTDTNGPGYQPAILADAYSNIGTSNSGYAVGVLAQTNDYVNNINAILKSNYTGSSSQAALRIERNGSYVGYITTSQTTSSFLISSSSGLVGDSTNQVSLHTNSNARITVTSTGNVGIGTDNPGSLLTLDHATNPAIQFRDSGTKVASINAEGTQTNIASFESKDLVFAASTSSAFLERLRITSDGNVGINLDANVSGNATLIPWTNLHVVGSNVVDGVAARNNAIPTGQLHVSSSGYGINQGGTISLGSEADNVNPNVAYASISGRRVSSLGYQYGGYLTLNVSDGSTLDEKVRITSSGNVGIGTDNPTFGQSTPISTYDPKLGVQGSITIGNLSTTASDRYELQFYRRNGGAGQPIDTHDMGRIAWYGSSNDSDNANLAWSIGVNPDGGSWTSGVNRKGYMTFNNHDGEQIRIASTGNVGIGTNNPQALLQLGSRTSATPQGNLHIARGEALGGGTGPSLSLIHGPDGGTQRSHQIYSYVGDLRIAADSLENMELHTGGSLSQIITSSGNVGIGTGNPQAKLDVNGGNARFGRSGLSILVRNAINSTSGATIPATFVACTTDGGSNTAIVYWNQNYGSNQNHGCLGAVTATDTIVSSSTSVSYGCTIYGVVGRY